MFALTSACAAGRHQTCGGFFFAPFDEEAGPMRCDCSCHIMPSAEQPAEEAAHVMQSEQQPIEAMRPGRVDVLEDENEALRQALSDVLDFFGVQDLTEDLPDKLAPRIRKLLREP